MNIFGKLPLAKLVEGSTHIVAMKNLASLTRFAKNGTSFGKIMSYEIAKSDINQ